MQQNNLADIKPCVNILLKFGFRCYANTDDDKK